MKLLFDENLSFRLARILADVYPGSAHVRDLGLLGTEDRRIWTFAAESGFIVTSKDADFYQRGVVLGAPPKVIWLRRCRSFATAVRDHPPVLRRPRRYLPDLGADVVAPGVGGVTRQDLRIRLTAADPA